MKINLLPGLSRNTIPHQFPAKRLNETVSHTLDWGNVLDTDTISTSVWDTEGSNVGLTAGSTSNTTTTTTAAFSGGGSGAEYLVINRITTAAGNILERALILRVDGQGSTAGGAY